MLKPVAVQEQISLESSQQLRAEQIKQKRVDDFKDKIRILVETPLFINSDLLQYDLVLENTRILQIIQKQYGIYGLLRASQINQRKCLQSLLDKKSIAITSLLPGIYDQQQMKNLKIEDE